MTIKDEDLLTQQTKDLARLAKKIHKMARKTGPVGIALANNKGGVGKTTITSNLANELANAGLKVLVIGLCLQEDLQNDFGIEKTDQGWSMVQAVLGQGQVSLVKNVRENVDAIFGGPKLMMLDNLTGANASLVPGGDPIAAFHDAVLDVADPYDVIVLDFPPGSPNIQTMGFSVTDWIVVPTKSDRAASVDGLNEINPIVTGARKFNPELRYAGAVLFATGASSRRIYDEWARAMGECEVKIPLFRTTLRYSELVAQDSRRLHLLVRELAEEAADVRTEIFAALKEKKKPTARMFSATTSPLTSEYTNLTIEILETITEESK